MVRNAAHERAMREPEALSRPEQFGADPARDSDVYTIGPDGSDLRRLTNFAPTREDRGSPAQLGGRVAGWTGDGRIAFTLVRWGVVEGEETALAPELWVMDADGDNARQLDDADLASLAAAACIDCPFPPDSDLPELRAFWRPVP